MGGYIWNIKLSVEQIRNRFSTVLKQILIKVSPTWDHPKAQQASYFQVTTSQVFFLLGFAMGSQFGHAMAHREK